MANNYIVPALDRAVEVLDFIANAKKPLSLHELSSLTGVPKSTVFRILFTLEKRRLVEQDHERKKFYLGFKLWELGNTKIEATELATSAIKHMRVLTDEVSENVFLGVLDHQDIIYIQRVECTSKIKYITKLGRRAPAYCTATGQAIIAFLGEDELSRFLDNVKFEMYNTNTITDKEKLLKKIKQIKELGYALADGEYYRELLCISCPIRDYTKKVIASITIDLLSTKQNSKKINDIIKVLRKASEKISIELGYLK